MGAAADRQATVLDVMILTAATSLGLWLARTYYASYRPGEPPFPVNLWAPYPPGSSFESQISGFGAADGIAVAPLGMGEAPPRFADRFRYWTQRPLLLVVPALPILMSWSLALLVLMRAREKLPLRRMAARPEFWVGIAVAAVIAGRLAGFAARQAALQWVLGGDPWRESATDFAWIVLLSRYPFAAPTEVGWMVAMAWSVLALGGRWRRTPGFVGWIGLALGGIWIAFLPLFYCWIGLFAQFAG